jgi:STE24 endopeptidase
MLGLGIVWLVELPFVLAAVWWERRHDVSKVGYLEWLAGGWVELADAFITISIALVIVMALARRLGSWWWIPAGAVFTAVALGFAWGSPLLETDVHETDDIVLQARFEVFQEQQGVSGIDLEIQDVSDETSQANAFASGLYDTRQVVVWDTLLDGRFDEDSVDVVLAHEVGHHSSEHIWKTVAWFGIFSLAAALVVMLATRRRGGWASPSPCRSRCSWCSFSSSRCSRRRT